MDGLLAPGGVDVESDGIALIRALTDGFGSALLLWAVVAAVLLCVLPVLVVVRRRRFRCAQADRDVEVAFEERGLPGHRRPIAVLSCSAFDPPMHVGCDRACLHREAAEALREPVAAGSTPADP
jgi:hypothetical protein